MLLVLTRKSRGGGREFGTDKNETHHPSLHYDSSIARNIAREGLMLNLSLLWRVNTYAYNIYYIRSGYELFYSVRVCVVSVCKRIQYYSTAYGCHFISVIRVRPTTDRALPLPQDHCIVVLDERENNTFRPAALAFARRSAVKSVSQSENFAFRAIFNAVQHATAVRGHIL